MGMKRYLLDSMDYAKTLKLRFCVGGLDLPERIKRYTSSRKEGTGNAQMYPCGKAVERRTHIVGGCETYKVERDVLEMRKVDECEMEKFGAVDSSEKTVDILGDRWWPQTAKQEGDKASKKWGGNATSAQMLEVALLGVGTVLRLERNAWSMVKRLSQSINERAALPPSTITQYIGEQQGSTYRWRCTTCYKIVHTSDR